MTTSGPRPEGTGGQPDTCQPGPDDAPGNVDRGDQVRHVETGQRATIAALWHHCGVTCVTVQYAGRSHLDNGGASTWWARAGTDAAAGVTR